MQIRLWGLLRKWVKYTQKIFHFLFAQTHLKVRLLNGFLRAMAQTTRSRTRVCLLGVKNSIRLQDFYVYYRSSRNILILLVVQAQSVIVVLFSFDPISSQRVLISLCI